MKTATHDVNIGESIVRKRFVEWSDREDEREWAMLSLLHEHAPGIAPRPIRRERDGDAPVIVIERLPGRPLAAREIDASVIAALGGTLHRMYQVPVAAARAIGLRERRVGPTRIVGLLQHELSQPQSLEACEDPVLVETALAAARHDVTLARAATASCLTSIGIADLNPANILWDGRVCRLVDFEDGGLTDPAFEIADHVEHIANRRTGNLSADALSAAVGLSNDAVARLESYRTLWAVFWLLMLLPEHGGFTRNPPGTTEDQARYVLRLLTAGA